MRPPWWKRLPGGPPAIELAPDTFGEALEEIIQAERATADEAADSIHVTAPPDRGALFTYQSLAESRLEQIRDLRAKLAAARAENTRLRADLGLAGQRLPCGGCQRLTEANTRLDDQLETCRREHLDKDAAEALRAQLAYRVGAAQPW